MNRVILGMGLLAGFLVLQAGEAKADHWDSMHHNHGRSSLPAYHRELNRVHSHQTPLNSIQNHRMHDTDYLYRDSYLGTPGYINRGSMNRIYSSPSIGCESDWNYGQSLRSRSIYQGNNYSW